jgi:hypothetical protein
MNTLQQKVEAMAKVGVGDLSSHNPLISLACGRTGSKSGVYLFVP